MEAEQLDETQKQAVADLKAKNKELLDKGNPYHDDFFFTRWLIARSWNVDQADEMLKASMKWRADEGIDTLVEEYGKEGNELREMLERYCPMGMHGVDKRGCPIYIERVGSFDIQGLLASASMEQLKRHHVFQIERAEVMKTKASNDAGKQFRKHYVIEDLSNLGWEHVSQNTLDLTKELLRLDESHFPESIIKLYIINAPWAFNAVWKIIKPVLSERTVNKIEILGTDFLPTLLEVVDKNELPVQLGGSCDKCNGQCVSDGGKIPESFYKGFDLGAHHENTVHEAVVPRSGIHEVRVPVAEGALLCYEFWTDDYDVSYGVAFCAKGESEQRIPILPVNRVNSHEKHITGSVTADKDGSFILIFDNSFSTFRKKQLHYKLAVPTATDEPDVVESDVAAK